MITLTQKLNVVSIGVPPIIHLSQYDSDFSLVFELYASTGNFTLPSGTTAEIRGTKADGNGYDADATVSGTTITVTGDEQMTAAAGCNVFEIALYKSGKRLNTINFILQVEHAALDADTITSESVLKELNAIIAGAATATQAAEDAEDAADRAGVSAEILSTAIPFTDDAKTALLACLQNLAWTSANGQSYYNALDAALTPKLLSSISAVFTQGQHVIYEDDDLETLRQYLVVTANYTDSTSAEVQGYTLSGTLAEGTSTITVTYGGKTTTFNATVSGPYWSYVWDASSESVPDGMQNIIDYDFTTTPGALHVKGGEINFDYMGECEFIIECRSTGIGDDNSPQFMIQKSAGTPSGTYNGAKFIFHHSNTPYVYEKITSASYTATSVDYRDYHVYDFIYESGTFTLKVDDTIVVTGSGGCVNDQYLPLTGYSESIYSYTDIKSIKFRRIQ